MNDTDLVLTLEANLAHVQSAFLALPGEPRLHAAIALNMLQGLARSIRQVEERAKTLPATQEAEIVRKTESLVYPMERLEEYLAGIRNGNASDRHIDRQTAAIFLFYISHQSREIGTILRSSNSPR